jgi:TatD DNase family protein
MTTTNDIFELIDIGANLTHESFRPDLNEVLQRAANVGVKTLIITGASEQGSLDAVALAEKNPDLHATTGVHPHHASDYTPAVDELLRKLANAPSVVAVGECGLDFYRDFSPRPVQESCFAAQLEIACDTGKPVFLHERDAHDRFVKVLGPFLKDLRAVVVHCFTGNAEQLDAYLELGCYIGLTGWICDERRGHHMHDFIAAIPGDRLMLETDAPYLLPRDIVPKPKTRRNEPCYLPHVLNAVARITGKPAAQIAAETTATAKRFFNL